MQLPNANRIVRRSGAGVTIDWYAGRERGAPRIASYRGATLADAERNEAAGAQTLAAKYANAKNPSPSKNLVGGLVVAYRASPEWKRLASSTQREWGRSLDQITADLGDVTLRAMGSRSARALILEWRDKWADKPRTADYRIQVLARLLSWAKRRAMIDDNHAEGIESLYAADRSDKIWTAAHLQAAMAQAPKHVAGAISLLAHTGLRVGDAVALTWAAVDLDAGEIVWKTSKSGGKREAVIPITKALRAALEGFERVGDTVLVTAFKKPWSSANALSHAIQKAAAAAGVERRTHDLRGTAATLFVQAGLTYPQVAMIMGWSASEVERIARRYVSKGAVSRAIAKHLDSVAEREAGIEPKGEN